MGKIAVIGGGASGMACAVLLARGGASVTLLERGGRLGKKLSATGNGQGNVTNLHAGTEFYFSDDLPRVGRILQAFPPRWTIAFLQSMGGRFLPDARGRVYPAGRQASAVTDLFRRELARCGVQVLTEAFVTRLARQNGTFSLAWEGGSLTADAVVLAAGGKAAKNFGTDGSAYALAEAFGHTCAPLSPVLVQLRCDPAQVRGLKGIRAEAFLKVVRGGEERYRTRGDVLFTESGVSGDGVFRASSYAVPGDTLVLDLLPDIPPDEVLAAIGAAEGEDCLLCLVNNGLGRVLYRRAGGDARSLAALLKGLSLTVTGTLGFDYAQATRGGIFLHEVTDVLESRFAPGLYFTGEILNVDGACGGYNLQWAFASAACVAQALTGEKTW